MPKRREPPIIVINRHGQTEALSGWRRWIAVGAGYLVFALIVLVGIAAAVGIAATALLVLAVAIPLAAVLWVIAYVMGYGKLFRRGGNRFSNDD